MAHNTRVDIHPRREGEESHISDEVPYMHNPFQIDVREAAYIEAMWEAVNACLVELNNQYRYDEEDFVVEVWQQLGKFRMTRKEIMDKPYVKNDHKVSIARECDGLIYVIQMII